MRLLFVFVLVLAFVYAGPSFKDKHSELRNIGAMFRKLEKRLHRQAKNWQRRARNARNLKIRRYRSRMAWVARMKSATRARLRREGQYNAARKHEERTHASLRRAEGLHRAAVRAYRNTHRAAVKNVKRINHELRIVLRIRRLLGLQHTGKYSHRQFRIHNFHRHGNAQRTHTHVGTHYHHGIKRFVSTCGQRGRALGASNVKRWRGHCYFLVNRVRNWPGARNWCRRHGTRLVSIHSHAQNRMVLNLLRSRKMRGGHGHWGNKSGWIGLNDVKKEGKWVWSDGSRVNYRRWAPGEPNNAGNEDWTQMYTQGSVAGKWNDIRHLSTRLAFVCAR